MSSATPSFAQLRVAAFESRNREEMARLIERAGGIAHVSPSMREVAIEENPEAVNFAHKILTGEIDVVIFLTGIGFKHLLTQIERKVDRTRFLNALSDIVTIARGPSRPSP